MERTTLGKTGLEVSRLGAGPAEIVAYGLSSAGGDVARVLNVALDGGINFLDTAACYGASEELIGRSISNRRQEYSLATKCGHVAGEFSGSSWSADTVKDSIERSLTQMNTDYLALVQLHSCDVSVLERGEASDCPWWEVLSDTRTFIETLGAMSIWGVTTRGRAVPGSFRPRRPREMMRPVLHGTQHRGEAALTLTTLGRSPGDLDLLLEGRPRLDQTISTRNRPPHR